MSNNSLKILEAVSDFIIDNPDQRFCQALYNLDILYDEVERSYNRDWEETTEAIPVDVFYDTDEQVMERIMARNKTIY